MSGSAVCLKIGFAGTRGGATPLTPAKQAGAPAGGSATISPQVLLLPERTSLAAAYPMVPVPAVTVSTTASLVSAASIRKPLLSALLLVAVGGCVAWRSQITASQDHGRGLQEPEPDVSHLLQHL